MLSIRDKLYKQEKPYVTEKHGSPVSIMVLRYIAIIGFIIFTMVAASVFIRISKQLRAEEAVKYQKLVTENSAFRLSQQKIDDGDIVYRIANGELLIYRKAIDYYDKPGRLGPAVIHVKTPYVKIKLVETVSIPKYEGKFNEKIYQLEQEGEVFWSDDK